MGTTVDVAVGLLGGGDGGVAGCVVAEVVSVGGVGEVAACIEVVDFVLASVLRFGIDARACHGSSFRLQVGERRCR